jgi:hypothetical protein
MKRVFVFCLWIAFPAILSAQDLTVEDIYLQQSPELQIIRDLGADSNRDLKTQAINYIGDVLERGDASKDEIEEIRKVLANLTMDGVRNSVRLRGRIVNNYPDLRIRAVDYLAKIATLESNQSLTRVLQSSLEPVAIEEDPAVITAAIRGIAQLALDDGGEALRCILDVFTRYNTLKPDNSLVLTVIYAIESLADKGVKDKGSIGVLLTIQTNYDYVKFVRDRASALVVKLRSMQ